MLLKNISFQTWAINSQTVGINIRLLRAPEWTWDGFYIFLRAEPEPTFEMKVSTDKRNKYTLHEVYSRIGLKGEYI